MGDILTAFCSKFKTEELHIYESDYWLWSLRPHQATLGAGILFLKRECPAFSQLTKEEHSDLDQMIKVIESTLSDLFQYDVINYLMLMMFDKHVHFHVVPRYESEREMFGDIWRDETWPGLPDLAGEPFSAEKLQMICRHIIEKTE